MNLQTHATTAAGDSVITRERIARAALAFIILAIGVAAVWTTIRLVVRYYSPAFFWDQWQILDPLINTHDHPGLRELWAQHNEHRILVQRLLAFADLFYFGGRSVSLLAETITVQFLHLALFVYVCRRWGNFDLTSFITLAGFFAYCFFSPLQMENFDWGFQVAFVLVGLSASAAFVLMLQSAQGSPGARFSPVFFPACIGMAAFTEMSNGNGILVWPLLSLLAFVVGLSWRKQAVLAASGAVGIAAYLIGYYSPGYHSDPLQTLRRPGSILKYMLTLLGYSWDANLPNPSKWPTVSESLAFLGILFIAALAFRSIQARRLLRPLMTFVLADSLFCIGTGAMAAAGRLKFGYGQATASRYQSVALLFWASLAIAVFYAVRTDSRRTKLLLGAGLAIVLIASLSRWRQIALGEMERKARLDQGWIALLCGDLTSSAIGYLYHTPTAVVAYDQYLLAHHLIPPPVPDLKTVPARMDAAACRGFIDHVTETGPHEVSASGWAYDYTRESGALRVAIAAPDGTILGTTTSGIRRDDVFKGNRSIRSDATGWSASWRLPHAGNYKVYVLLNGAAACPLQGSVNVP